MSIRKSNQFDLTATYKEHSAWLLRRMRQIIHDVPTTIIEDACSHAWEQAWSHRDLLAGFDLAHLRGWLALTARREALLLVERGPGREVSGDTAEMIFASAVADTPAVERGVIEGVHAERRLAVLRPDERVALTLLASGFIYKDIAEITGWTYTKVNRCITEGRARLREA